MQVRKTLSRQQKHTVFTVLLYIQPDIVWGASQKIPGREFSGGQNPGLMPSPESCALCLDAEKK